MHRMILLGLVSLIVLAGCSDVPPIQQDQPLLLAAGDGIAAVQFDTLDAITQVQIVSVQSDGKTMNIPSVPLGRSTYLFEVPAGRYCLQRFWYGKELIFHKGEYVDCFVVKAGEISFSGVYSPHGGVDLGRQFRVVVGQDLDVSAARAELIRNYPHIAAQFLQPEPAPTPIPAAATQAPTFATPVPSAPVAPPPAGKDLVSTWVGHDDKMGMDTVYLRNNTKWALVITTFELYDCANIKQACKLTHPGFKLAPHETKSYMQVQPNDPQGAYSFHYRLSYGFD